MPDSQTLLLFLLLFLPLLVAFRWFGGGLRQATGANWTDERRFRELFEHSSDAIFVVESARQGYRFESLNPAALEMLASTEMSLAGRHFDELTKCDPDGLLASLLRNMSHRLEHASKIVMPVHYRDESSSGESYDIQLVHMVDDSGISHFLCFARDITAQLRYERELQQRAELEARLSGFMESAPGFFYTFVHGEDRSNSMPFASEGIEELFGLRPEQVEAHIAELNMRIHPDDLSAVFGAIARSVAEMSPYTVEFRAQHPQRGEIWVESRAKPVARDDGSVEWNGFMHDISTRKSMEHALRDGQLGLAEAQRIGQMGSWELDIASGDLSWSDQIYRIFEIDPAVFGASYEAFLNAIHPDDRAAVNRAYRESLTSRAPYSIDHRLQFPDGRIKYVRECCETHYDEAGNPHHSHGTVQDITAIKEAELKLKETQNKLRELVIDREKVREDERQRVAWEMHEELGQILSVIKMNLRSLRAGGGDKQLTDRKWGEVISLVDRSIKTMHDIVSDLRPTVLLHGIVPGLEWLVAEYGKHAGMSCHLKMHADHGDQPDEALTTLLFRLAEEAMEDAIRHPGVGEVWLDWCNDDEKILLSIRHDGEQGTLDLTGRYSLRLFGMQERITASGGKMRVTSNAQAMNVIEIEYIRTALRAELAAV